MEREGGEGGRKEEREREGGMEGRRMYLCCDTATYRLTHTHTPKHTPTHKCTQTQDTKMQSLQSDTHTHMLLQSVLCTIFMHLKPFASDFTNDFF